MQQQATCQNIAEVIQSPEAQEKFKKIQQEYHFRTTALDTILSNVALFELAVRRLLKLTPSEELIDLVPKIQHVRSLVASRPSQPADLKIILQEINVTSQKTIRSMVPEHMIPGLHACTEYDTAMAGINAFCPDEVFVLPTIDTRKKLPNGGLLITMEEDPIVFYHLLQDLLVTKNNAYMQLQQMRAASTLYSL